MDEFTNKGSAVNEKLHNYSRLSKAHRRPSGTARSGCGDRRGDPGKHWTAMASRPAPWLATRFVRSGATARRFPKFRQYTPRFWRSGQGYQQLSISGGA
jgi:hypothetical protein